jgi:hypothetical protein
LRGSEEFFKQHDIISAGSALLSRRYIFARDVPVFDFRFLLRTDFSIRMGYLHILICQSKIFHRDIRSWNDVKIIFQEYGFSKISHILYIKYTIFSVGSVATIFSMIFNMDVALGPGWFV